MRSMRVALPVALLVLLAPAPPALAAPAAQAGQQCDRQRADEAFKAGIKEYARHRWGEAIPDLQTAAAVCPAPQPGWEVTVGLFGSYQYLPFYFLGKCHYNLKDLPDALRHFYLSRCVDEPSRGTEREKGDLGSLPETCRRQIQSRQRPPSHPQFVEGRLAAGRSNFQAAADEMWEALLVWEDDASLTTSSGGRFPTSYVPRFHLGEALFELGCFREACQQFERTKLNQLNGGAVASDRQRLEERKAECERRRRETYPDQEICRRWRCWLGQERAGTP
jgi:tetratricopeptide (TPR) repeat protein